MAEGILSSFDQALAAAKQDGPTVTADGVPIRRLTEGVTIRKLTTHTDDRGTVMELFNPQWGFNPDPLVHAYTFTIRPGIVKGWNLHRKHEDRYALLQGEMELVLYDLRPGSSTHGEICSIRLSEHERSIVNVPIDVWHADYNFGIRDALVVNFPTKVYDYNAPDKYRLPIDTPLIPHRFPTGTRGG